MDKQYLSKESLVSVNLIEIMNEVSVQLLDAKDETEIYRILADAIKKILPGSYFIITKLQQDDMNFRIIESSGFEKYLSIIKTIAGKDVFTMDFPFQDLTDDQLETFKSRKIRYFSEGIHGLTHDQLNKTICRAIEKVLGIEDVFASSFCVKNKYFGGITLFIPSSLKKSGTMNKDVELAIEIISNQTSTVIQKLRDEAEIKKNEEKLKERTKQLIELNNTKDKFFSIIAHDLKSPFNSILGFTEILSENYYDYSDVKRLSIINMIDESTHSVYKLLENLLDWSRLQQGHIQLRNEVINLKALVIESIEPYIQNALQKGIVINNNIEANLIINTDRNSIKTVIRNIFNNAIKYTTNGGSVELISKENNNHIELIIKDTGVGMSDETICKLFCINESISTPGTNKEKGTGLGLIISKELIDKINGEIWIDSELGKGTIFQISIPA